MEFDLADELPWLVWVPVGVEKFRVRIGAELGGVAPAAEFVLE